jgi:hypothetical protein
VQVFFENTMTGEVVGIRLKNGNPAPGKFDFKHEDLGGIPLDEYDDEIYLLDLVFDLLEPDIWYHIHVAAHADVIKETDTELVDNGGFETPAVTHTNGWDIFPSGTTGLGWTVEWLGSTTSYGGQTRPETANLELHSVVNSWLHYEGSQHAELDTDWDGPDGGLSGEPASVKLYQNLTACESGLYTMNYAWSPRPGHDDNEIEVRWNESLLDTHSGVGGSNTNWTLETHQYIAGPSEGTVTLEFCETANEDSLGMFLDGVSVVCVREETAWGGYKGIGPDYDLSIKFPGKNWAIYLDSYIDIMVIGPSSTEKLGELVSDPSNSIAVEVDEED